VNRTRGDDVVLHDARHCCWREAERDAPFSAATEAACLDAAARGARFCGGAQTGAVAVAAGTRSRDFAVAWADAYLAHWTAAPAATDAFASDQVTLRALQRDCARYGGGALPGALHVRAVAKAHRKVCDLPLFGFFLEPASHTIL